jgi:hypothetical protein
MLVLLFGVPSSFVAARVPFLWDAASRIDDFANADVPAEFQADIGFNATEARRVKEEGQDAIETKMDPLPSVAQKKAELLSFGGWHE